MARKNGKSFDCPTQPIARFGTTFYASKILNEKKEAADSAQPDFWSQRYSTRRIPWQLERVPRNLSAFIRALHSRRKVLIPGCGEDYRTIDAFRHAGHQVTGIDFSPVAIEQMKKALTDIKGQVMLGDFFSFNFESASFDIVYERTFLCSLPPRLWTDYAARVAQLLRPGGALAGFFFYGKESDPPPYPLTESRASELFGNRFDLVKSEPVTDSVPIFAGTEKWQEWRLR